MRWKKLSPIHLTIAAIKEAREGYGEDEDNLQQSPENNRKTRDYCRKTAFFRIFLQYSPDFSIKHRDYCSPYGFLISFAY